MRQFSDSGRSLSPAVKILRWAAEAMLLVLVVSYLSDILSPVFTAAVFIISLIGSRFLEKSGLRLVPALAAAGVFAFVVRFIVLSAAGIIPGGAESAFTGFRFDSGFFPLLPAVLYIVSCSILERRKAGFIYMEVFLNAAVFCLLLWKQGGYEVTVFPHPGILAVFSIIFIIIEIIVLVLYSSGSGKKGPLSFLVMFIPVFLVILLVLFGRYSEGASKEGGGLMQPTLFRFDFSDYVKLESEIKMDNDLVLLFRNYGYLNSVYLRRFYLSGYKPERGFFLQSGPDEDEQQLTLPDKPLRLDVERYARRVQSEQEYFIVNFDPSSLIAMNYPVEISPLTNWKGSSFLQNYRVLSESVELPSWELSEAPLLEMDSDLYEFYTEYGGDYKVKELAENITAGLVTPYDKVIAIMFYLHDTYYYSLKPGVAADGNQLHHFLFTGKKGYCSYFAFSMALMCRSLGIPARVAAGFFIDPQSGILNVYPVREDMAHAWVEVPFEDFGWVEFDPTTERIAPGEDITFGMLDSSEYSELVEEIFANEYSIDSAYSDENDSSSDISDFNSMMKKIGRILKRNPVKIILLLYTAAVLLMHLLESVLLRFGSGKSIIKRQYKHAVRLASAFGYRRAAGESILEHAERVEEGLAAAFRRLAETYLESVFSPGSGSEAVPEVPKNHADFIREFRMQSVFKRLLLFVFPFIRFKSGRKSVPGSLIIILMLPFMLTMTLQPVSAQDSPDFQFYLEAAEREQDSENYEAALQLLNEGIALYPDNWELKKAAGDLYSDRELYNLALEQFNLALELNAGNIEILYARSVTEGLLNLDQQSIQSLEEILSLVPDHYDALADLGWMYFKTFRLNEAEELLLGAVKLYEDSPILYMTLGTVYSGMYDYEEAEKYYLKSISMALDKGWNYFASVSYYNLSLLEHGFYRFEKALEYTNNSIETGERAPGYIARAEINLGRLDFKSAYNDYQTAYTLDSTPLALMGLADLYLTFGRLDEALSHIREVINHNDDSWMYYFGVDPERHRMETDRLLMEIYYGMENRARFSPEHGFGRIKTLFDRLRFRCLGWFHERRYRSASFEVGCSNEQQGNRLDAAWSFYIANFNYRKTASGYLKQAEAIETAVAPGAEGSYLLETGRLLGDVKMLNRALNILDPEWERMSIAEAVAGILVRNKRNRDISMLKLAERLYILNPGMFITEAIRFPVNINFKPGFFLKRALKRSGFNILSNNQDNSYRYRLTAADNLEEGSVYSVYDTVTGDVIFRISAQKQINTPAKASAFTAELKKRLFRTADGESFPF